MADSFSQFIFQLGATQAGPHTAEAAGGLSALGLNLQAFLFQLTTFVIVLLLLRKFVFGKLVSTLEERRLAVEKSLDDASKTEAELKKAQEKVVGLIREARAEAEGIVATGHKEAAQMVEAAEAKAATRAEHIVKEAKAQMDVELGKAREALKADAAKLVAMATERIIKQKLDPQKDAQLIKAALTEAQEQPHA